MIILPENFKVRITKEQIEQSICSLGQKITQDYVGRKLLVEIVANGGIYFGVDLTRQIELPVLVDVVKTSSYFNNQRSNDIHLDMTPKINPDGYDVLIVDDVYDSGSTLEFLKCYFMDNGATSVKTCSFINKKIASRKSNPDYFCLNFENEFAIGYGLDYDEFYRNLPYIGVKQ